MSVSWGLIYATRRLHVTTLWGLTGVHASWDTRVMDSTAVVRMFTTYTFIQLWKPMGEAVKCYIVYIIQIMMNVLWGLTSVTRMLTALTPLEVMDVPAESDILEMESAAVSGILFVLEAKLCVQVHTESYYFVNAYNRLQRRRGSSV